MARKRGLDRRFLAAMRQKLDSGRSKGFIGYESHWQGADFWEPPDGPFGWFLNRLQQEIAELIIALHQNDLSQIRSECADVANFAMFIADIHGALEEAKNAGQD